MGMIAYITTNAPFGKGEGFVVNEMIMLKKLGADLFICPRDYSKDCFHKGSELLAGDTYATRFLNLRIFKDFLEVLFSNKGMRLLWEMVALSRNLKILAKNLAVFPKAGHLALKMRKKGVSVIHAHWGTTTSTMAYVIHRITGIPWGMTLHRWDITENNLLETKLESAAFVRCISESAKRKLNFVAWSSYDHKITVIHMGTDCRVVAETSNCDRGDFTILVPATFFERKGHRYLIDATEVLKARGIRNIRCRLYGLGPLKNDIEEAIKRKGLGSIIEMADFVPQHRFEEMYRKREVDAVVLPSFDIGNEDGEGVPVCLMDAMAYGVPVVSTDAGGIPELIGNGSGIMVQQRNAEQLADAIEMLIKDKGMRCALGEKGKRKVARDFNLRIIAESLLGILNSHGRKTDPESNAST